MPKSRILARFAWAPGGAAGSSLTSMMLPGLRSRWTMVLCAAASPEASCQPKRRTSDSGIAPR